MNEAGIDRSPNSRLAPTRKAGDGSQSVRGWHADCWSVGVVCGPKSGLELNEGVVGHPTSGEWRRTSYLIMGAVGKHEIRDLPKFCRRLPRLLKKKGRPA
jgi:hypothetical protein